MMENHLNLAISALEKLDDSEIAALQFTLPWQYTPTDEETQYKDADGFVQNIYDPTMSRESLQQVCWTKFNKNPYVGTSVRGQVGRLTGWGFEVSSEIAEVNDVIIETEFDPRNQLYNYWSKFVGRSIIEGELFLGVTIHKDSFVEVDFIDPKNVGGGGTDGVIYHPTKTTMPLAYYIKTVDSNDPLNQKGTIIVPSIFLAYYPDLYKYVQKSTGFNETLIADSRDASPKFKKLKGFKRFIVSWDKSFITQRNTSYLRTILEWLNHYETLKKYEIDHKKSAGAYVWVIYIEDPKAFRTWLSLSDEERRKTGIMAKKTPGSTLILPPGMKMEAQTPKLPNISESDTDILHMVTGGLNEPEDVSTGQSKGTFASVKASRGPMSDRMSDEIAYFDRFLKFDFYRAVFYLKAAVGDFPKEFSVREAVDYKKQKPVFKTVKKQPMFLVDVTYPVSEVNDPESKAKAFLGVKHGSVYDTLQVPNSEIAKRMGFGNYSRLRLKWATEDEKYPPPVVPLDEGGEQMDQEGLQPMKKQNSPGTQKPGDTQKPGVKPIEKQPEKKKIVIKK
jgi:hypothetical protein